MKHTFDFDVMVDDRFVCTMQMPFNPLFPVTQEEVDAFVTSKRPSLSNRNYKIKI